MSSKVYNIGRNKMYDSNSTKARREGMEVYCCMILIVHVSCCNIT